MKQLLGVILMVALVADIGLFVGVGFGLNALSATGAPALHQTCEANGQTSGYGSTGTGGLAFCVYFAIPLTYNGVYVSNWQGAGSSTAISYVIDNVNNVYGGCDNQPYSGWAAGSGVNSHGAYAVIQVIDSITGLPVSLANQSTASFSTVGTVTQGSTAFYVSYNASTPSGAVCEGGSGYPTNQTLWGVTTFTLNGEFDDYSIISVQFVTTGPWCNLNGGGSSTPACTGQYDGTGYSISGGTPSGTSWAADSYGQVYLRNGGATADWNGQTLYNGQSFSVTVVTHYDAGRGFLVQFLYPAVRGGALIAKVVAPDDSPGFSAHFTVPSNAAINTTDPTYNWFQVTVTSVVTGYVFWNQPIDVSPLYAPPPAVVTFSDLTPGSSGRSPEIGDNIQINIAGQGISSTGETISSIYIWSWYMTPNTTSGSLPPTGSPAYISTGGIRGQSLPVDRGEGINVTAAFTFTISQGWSIMSQVELVTNTAQTSVSSTTLNIYVKPPGCTGPTCNQKLPNAEWLWLGPLLFSVAVILAAAVIAFYVPNPYARYGALIAAFGFVVAAYLFGVYTGWFNPGGVFDSGG
jgi:hypothetical protein